MSSDYEKPITIEESIEKIVGRRLLLPAIQRKFTWSSSQICVLFDSIMRGYPINTFMFWEVVDPKIKNSFRFYQFLEHYCERFQENNPDFDTKGHGNFSAVIDGQQRLTSLYLGLKGSYAYKLKRKWWPSTKDESILPPRKLYLNLAAPLDEEANEEMMQHDFRFLTNSQFEADQDDKTKFWFLVGDVLDFPKAETSDDALDYVMEYLQEQGQETNKYARKTLTRLYFAIRRDKTVHFFKETNQSIDRVLDIFIRTNHGGTPLSFSDLLMSIAIANWKKDARQQIDDLVNQVRFGSDMEFSINRDFVLKAALTIVDADVKFKVKNFTAEQVAKIESDWDDIKACILEVFRLIRSFGLNDASLRAKNAAIPIAYYLFHKGRKPEDGNLGIFSTINSQAKHIDDRAKIRQWLHMSLLKGAFGGQSDSLLTSLRKVIKEEIHQQAGFPLEEIIASYRGTNKDLAFDDDFIKRLLRTQKEDSSCFSILALLFPDRDYTQPLDIDHLHPASAFRKDKLDAESFLDTSGNRPFYENRENWNSIVNLHLLNASKNRSKSDSPLKEWLAEQNSVSKDDLLIPESVDLSFKEFESFITKREAYLEKQLHSLAMAENG